MVAEKLDFQGFCNFHALGVDSLKDLLLCYLGDGTHIRSSLVINVIEINSDVKKQF